MTGYATKNVADLIGFTPSQLRHYVRRGLVQPVRDQRGEYRFSFQDVVLLRTAKQLADEHIPMRRAMRILLKLKHERHGPALSGMRIFAEGTQVMVRRARSIWDAETGQAMLDFNTDRTTQEQSAGSNVSRLANVAVLPGAEIEAHEDTGMDSDDWYNLGLDLEETAIDRAPEAYLKAIRLDPSNVDAYVNLGRLLQLRGNLRQAKRYYQQALERVPDHQLALYNLGTLYDELDELELAIGYYKRAVSIADAHYNLARIHELRGDGLAAHRYLRSYQRMLEKA
jgi:tetratricopeptide (TPR) repeat protein